MSDLSPLEHEILDMVASGNDTIGQLDETTFRPTKLLTETIHDRLDGKYLIVEDEDERGDVLKLTDKGKRVV